MEIDLFTVIAQIVNFIILLLLLKYLLYGRITEAMDKREEMIASRINDAELKKSEADEKYKDLLRKEEQLERESKSRLRKAAEEAEASKKVMLEDARHEVEETKKRWHESVRRQQQSFLRELRLRSGEEVYAVARKALSELADADLETQIALAFIARLRDLPDPGKQEIFRLVQDSSEGIAVHSSFDLAEELKKNLLEVLHGQFGKELSVSFELSSELVCGIELRAGDRRVSWTLDNYLSTLEDKVTVALEETGTSEG